VFTKGITPKNIDKCSPGEKFEITRK